MALAHTSFGMQESLKEKTLALLSVADRNKELQNALEESRRQLAEAVAAQQQAETRAAQAVSAQRKVGIFAK